MRRKADQVLAIVVVNYASHALLAKNLAHVAGENPAAIIVVVDSFSSDTEQSMVRQLSHAHGWLLVETTKNVGFGGGMNAGVAQAKAVGATSFLLLNPDAVISHRSVEVLEQELEQDSMALLSPLIFDADGRPWFSGADVRLDNGRTQSASRTTAQLTAGDTVPTWPWLSGACLMLSESLWDATGGFDERYFLYWEDVDFSRRVVTNGGRLRVVEDAHSVHDEGGTQKSDTDGTETSQGSAMKHHGKSAQYYYYNTRNRLLFAALHLQQNQVQKWVRSAVPAAWDILMRGGKRQLVYTRVPLRAVFTGTRDGLRMVRIMRQEVLATKEWTPPEEN